MANKVNIGSASMKQIVNELGKLNWGRRAYAVVVLCATTAVALPAQTQGGTENVDVAYKFAVLYTFTGGADGSGPYSSVVRDSAGSLYGTTCCGGSANGVVYKVDTAGQETVLYTFTGGADGSNPIAVIRGPAGALYGTTYSGGEPGSCYGRGCGVVFKVSTSGHETVLYSFTGGADGGTPLAGVIGDSAGNLYGTTSQGGDLSCYVIGCGVVFEVGTSSQETVLYTFTGLNVGTDGGFPNAVIRDSAGNLYGTTGGGPNYGVVYKLDTLGNYTVLYSFTGGADGGGPEAGVIRDSAGNLYGTTYGGGSGGVVYKVDTSGQETVLYSFTGGADGGGPEAGVIRDSAGNLYGTTYGGGSGQGVVYKVDTSGHETVLHTFTGGADGGHPAAGLIRGGAGNLFGTASSGGKYGAGVVFELKPQ